MARARLNGIEIDYDVSGSGPAVLLSHGYSATRRMWDGQHRALEGRYTVISWSMRGHGETESPDDPAQYSEELTVGDMRALLRHVGVERAIVGGLSLGGYASLGFSLAHPEMVRALVIVGDQDQPFLAPCEYMAKKIPGARLEVIAGAGHSSNLDQPEAFNRVLLDFLGALPPEPARR